MNNSEKIILDLCGGTGSWSRPYKEAGYDVKLITLPDYDVLEYEPSENVYGILAAPPCTEFSIAKSTVPRDFHAGMEIVKACMDIIWKCRLDGALKFWCMENPRGFLRQFMGKPPFIFEQWEYGEPRVKPTDLWGYFNEPAKTVSVRPKGLTTKFPNGRTNTKAWSSKSYSAEYAGTNLTVADIRAITPAGFAQAFFKANP